MRGKVGKKLAALLLATVFAVLPGIPGIVQAAEPTIEGHGLVGEWYSAKAGTGRDDINRFEFDENNYLGSIKTGNLNGENLRPLISDLLGHTNDEQFVLARFTGEVEIEAGDAGDYTFYMFGDDGFRLYIDDQMVIDFWEQKWEIEKSAVVTLEEGRHDIQVEFLQGWGGANLKLQWESTDASIAKEIIPESAFYQKRESYYKDAIRALQREIESCEAVVNNIAGSSESRESLQAEIDNAKAVRDADYAETAIDDIIAIFSQTTEDLVSVKTWYYLNSDAQQAESFTEFYNPLYQGQDPFVTQKDGFYYLVSSSNWDDDRKMYVSKSRTLTDQGEKKMIMDFGDRQRRIFAPEMFFFDDEEGGHWYIYYCADVLDIDRDYPEMAAAGYSILNEGHIACCLRSQTADPMGEWDDMGPLYCGENNKIHGANDITAVEYDGSIFLIWGTIGPNEPLGPAIVEMDNPYTVTKDRDILPIGGGEGPRAIKNEAGQLFVTMSEGDYASDGYRLSILCFTGERKEELLDDDKWYAKLDVFTSTNTVSGPARASFVKSADGTEDWMVFHSRVYKEVDRNWWRQVNIKKFDWNEDGTPNFGAPISTNKKLQLPSGDPGQGDMYQAEDAIVEGGSEFKDENNNFLGNGYVNVPNKNGAAISFVVEQEEAGDYIAGVRYAYGERKDGETTHAPSIQLPARASLSVYVNGERIDTLEMDKTSFTWNEWFTGSMRLPLNAGKNLITYKMESGCVGNVNLDYLTLYEADVPYTSADIIPQSVNLDKDFAVVGIGESTQIKSVVQPENAAQKGVSYSISDEQVAVVDSAGKVTGRNEGKAVVTVTAVGNGKATAEFTVVVTKKQDQKPGTVIRPAYIETAKEMTLTVGGSKMLTTKVYPSYAKDCSVTYRSSNTKVASIDSKGNIKAKEAGTATITIKANGDSSVTQTCKVTVKPAKVKGVKATRSKKNAKITVSWKKQKGVTGYQVYRADKKKGKYKLVKTVKKASKVKFVDKKAKKGKSYYYKVRAYKKISGKKVTGAYSATKKGK